MRGMAIEVEYEEALRRWDDLVRQVTTRGERVVVIHKGRCVGVLIGREDMEFLEQHEELRERERAPPVLS